MESAIDDDPKWLGFVNFENVGFCILLSGVLYEYVIIIFFCVHICSSYDDRLYMSKS